MDLIQWYWCFCRKIHRWSYSRTDVTRLRIRRCRRCGQREIRLQQGWRYFQHEMIRSCDLVEHMTECGRAFESHAGRNVL